MATRSATTQLFRNDLLKFMARSRLYPFVEYHTLDTVRIADDFLGDTLNGDLYAVANGGGASAASPVITGGALNGVLDFVTGTAGNSTASSQLTSGLSFRGDHSPVLVACLTVDIITSVKIEIGFTDVATDAGAVATKATPTFNAADCAVWCLDTNDNAYWEGLAANNTSTAPMATVEAAISPVAATYEWLMVEIVENDATSHESVVYFRRFTAAGLLTYEGVGGKGPDNQGPNTNVLLTPWLYIEARNGDSKTMSVDYLGVWQRRTA